MTHIARAEYDPETNAVNEILVISFEDYDNAYAYIAAHKDEPIYAYDVYADGTPYECLFTRAYREECKKIKDEVKA